MRTAVTTTSIDAFRAHRGNGRAFAQRDRILHFIREQGGDWSIGELAGALELDKSTVSARVHELLNDTRELVAKPRRKDGMSGVTVRPVGLPAGQRELFR